jgi:hypothetical protein
MDRHYDRDFSTDDRTSSGVRESRTGTQDSEEAALSNGRKTLEEVAAKLNDLEGAEKGKLGGGKGLVSMNRLPFISNLFNYRASHNGIVVDEEDANQEDNPIADIFIWRFPLVSVIWFCALQVIFFLVHFCDFSFLFLAAFLGLWQLVVDLTLVQVVPKLQAGGMLAEDIDIKEVLRRNTLFNPRLIKRLASLGHELSDIMIGMWRMTVMEANMSRVLIVGRFVFVVFFRSFSVPTTFYVILMILFTIPVSYAKNRVFADAVADGAHITANRNFASLKRYSRTLVEIAANHARDNYERSKKGTNASQNISYVKSGFWAFTLAAAQNLDWFVDRLFG